MRDLTKLGDDHKWHGNFMKMVVLKSKVTGAYENVQVLYDHNRMIGLFVRESQAHRWWILQYIPSKRSIVLIPEDKWDLEGLV